MKNVFILSALLFLVACGDDDKGPYTCSECSDVPEAAAANNSSGKGIYKGSVVGSSGTLILNIDNAGDGHIFGTLVIDGEEIPLETDATYATGFFGDFVGTMHTEGDVQINFYVNAIGASIDVGTVVIPGHTDVTIQIMKELSTQLVEVYEGTFVGDDDGTFNLLILRDDQGDGDWYALSKSNGITYFEGYMEGNGIYGGGGEFVIVGIVRGDNVNGDWEHISGGIGTWRGKRTL
jgi:hypothetical protein